MRAIIAEPEEMPAERLRAAVAAAGVEESQTVGNLTEALDATAQLTADVVVMGPTLVSDVAFDFATQIAETHATATVVVASAVDSHMLRQALRAGVADLVSLADTVEDIADAVKSGVAATRRMRATSGADSAEAEAPRGKVITVFSTKGGVGKTVLATNLAAALARDTERRVALVDLDLEFGDVAIMLGIKPERTIADIVQVFERLDAEMLEGYMSEHDSGVRVLLAPVRPEDAETVSAAKIIQILDLLRAGYDYVVVDTSPSFSEAVLAALDMSNEVFVVTMMDVASIKNTRISLQKLRQLGYDSGRIRIVLNRSDSKVLLQPGEVEQAIGDEVTAHIPSDRMVPRSVNKGVPIVLDVPKSEVARSIVALAREAARTTAKEAEDVA